LARAHDQRGAAEYNVEFAVDTEAIERLVRDAQRFMKRMGANVTSKGVRLARDDE
jgi:hypothetical protein